ncbi:eCIS core domain-containing protein [Rhodopirellula sp. JC639]|uniref:eCIS core domain-containing protein n=1 Tax=Stieleria mannarensis TaxID=2755585 RepID=UPI0015FFA8E1|nr:DUF4157 domain-containing protein [Rhodopirellula sp. JC639]
MRAHPDQHIESQSIQPRLAALILRLMNSPSVPIPYQRELQERFGANLDHVRVFFGSIASRAAAMLGAEAFTFGRHVVFGDANPDMRLVAHELVHVLQQPHQGRIASLAPNNIGRANCDEEQEADEISDALVSGQPIRLPRAHASPSTIYANRRRQIEHGLHVTVFRWITIPGGRAPSVVDIEVMVPHAATDDAIEERIIVALRSLVTSQQSDRAPGLVRSMPFRGELHTHLQRERVAWSRDNPHALAMGRPMELWIPIRFIHMMTGPGDREVALDAGGRPHVDRIEIDQSRYPAPLPVPPSPPGLDEIVGWLPRLAEDESVDPTVRRMAQMMLESDSMRRLDGKYLTSGQVRSHCHDSTCTQSSIERGASDVYDIVGRARARTIGSYRQFRREFEAVRPAVQAGFDELHRIHSAESTRIEVVAGPDVHAWIGRRQRSARSLYYLFGITACGWGGSDPCIENPDDFRGG